jgi:chemotaxis signal transduction protein
MSDAQRLRREFDDAFARAPAAPAGAVAELLAIRVGGDPHLLRLDELAGLFAGHSVTRLPARRPELLGVASFRGAVVPIFDLAALAGYPRGGEARWLVLCARRPVALAFDGYDGYRRVDHAALVPVTGERHVGATVVVDGAPRPVLSLGAIVETLERTET